MSDPITLLVQRTTGTVERIKCIRQADGAVLFPDDFVMHDGDSITVLGVYVEDFTGDLVRIIESERDG